MMKYFVCPGVGRLFIDGKTAGELRFERFGGFGHPTIHTETLDVSRDLGSPAGAGYRAPYSFAGKVDEVRFTVQ